MRDVVCFYKKRILSCFYTLITFSLMMFLDNRFLMAVILVKHDLYATFVARVATKMDALSFRRELKYALFKNPLTSNLLNIMQCKVL